MSRIPPSTWALAALLCTGAIGSEVHAAAPDGIWRSQGYGVVGEVRTGKTTLYDITSISCVKQPPVPGITDALFENATVTHGGKRLITKAPWGLTTLYFDRIAMLPKECAAPQPNAHDPLYNFDVFWQIFDDYYAFFKERGVDWADVRNQYRPKISAKTTDEELTEIFRQIFRQLQDRHVSLSVGQIRVNAGFTEIFNRWYREFAQHPVGSRGDFLHRQIVTYLSPSWAKNLDSGSVVHVSDNVTTATAEDGRVGYAMLGGESGFADGDLETDKKAGIDQLDAMVAGFAGKRGIILDMRINYGGHDDVALALAGLLTKQTRAGFSKCTRSADGFTPVQHSVIRPRPNAFTGPVVVIVSPMNWSSGENIAMMVKDFDNVIVIGDHTASVHSDVLTKYLPNGWRLTLSNELFGAPDGTMYEGVGVPPDILVPYDADEVRATGIDPNIEKALHLLRSDNFAALAKGAKRQRASGRVLPCK
jgi:carboxyl-terminal processing protease